MGAGYPGWGMGGFNSHGPWVWVCVIYSLAWVWVWVGSHGREVRVGSG
jgi:hypothetical protein